MAQIIIHPNFLNKFFESSVAYCDVKLHFLLFTCKRKDSFFSKSPFWPEFLDMEGSGGFSLRKRFEMSVEVYI